MEVSISGLTDEMETEIVITAGSDGAINTALHPGSMEVMPPSFTCQLTIAFGEMNPSRDNSISSPVSILHSSGRMVAVFVGITTALVVEMSDNKTAAMRTTLRDINIPGFHE